MSNTLRETGATVELAMGGSTLIISEQFLLITC